MPKKNGKEPTQETHPRYDEGAEGPPTEIPVPKRADVLAALHMAERQLGAWDAELTEGEREIAFALATKTGAVVNVHKYAQEAVRIVDYLAGRGYVVIPDPGVEVKRGRRRGLFARLAESED